MARASSGKFQEVNRRQVLVAGAGVPLALAARPIWAQAVPIPVIDMHVHLFNVTDLPIAGFVSHVFRHGSLGKVRGARALADYLGRFAKKVAASATEELAAIGPPEQELRPDEFGVRSAEFVDQRLKQLAQGGPSDQELGESYNELMSTLVADAGYEPALVSQTKSFSVERARSPDEDFQKQLNAFAFATVARKAEEGAVIDPGIFLERHASPVTKGLFTDEIPLLSGLSRMIGWGYTMAKTRRSHIRQFLESYSDSRAAPAMAVHHLVDYDYWLDDEPAAGSAMPDQVRVFSRLADRFSSSIDLRTFAAFCPLRHAVETLKREQTLFDQLKPFVATGQVSGFKLYPPMGFMPSGNADLDDPAFDPAGRAPTTALKRWRDAGGGPGLGQAIEASLREFYRWTAQNGVPIMAHAGPGNEAGPGFGARANPIHWEAVAAEFPIRLSLGHLVNDAKPFIKAVRNGAPYPEDVWALDGSLRLLDPGNPNLRAEVYGDLGYMPELIDDRTLARDFFIALRQAFGARDPELTRILYGSDWIMLGIEPHFERNLSHMIDGMRAAGYTAEQQENILYRNGRRFMRA